MSVAPEIQAVHVISASVTEDQLTVRLEDGRTISTPLAWYPRLMFATPEELQNFEIMPGGDGLHWPDFDEHLSVRGMVLGRPSGERAYSLKRWKQEMRRRRREGITGSWQSANRATYEAHDYPPEGAENR